MRFLSCVALTLMVCFILPVSAFADEVDGDPISPEVQTEATDPNTVVNVYLPESFYDPGIEDPSATEPEVVVEEEEDPEVLPSYSVTQLDENGSAPVADPEQQTMKDVVTLVLGDYSPRTQTVTQYLSDGSTESHTEIVPGVAGLDWEWISGAGLFGLVLFSFLKLVGVLLKNG